MEMERGENIMVVTHQAVLRCIYAYFMNVPQDQSPWMEIPLHTVIKLTPRAYGTQEERFVAPPAPRPAHALTRPTADSAPRSRPCRRSAPSTRRRRWRRRRTAAAARWRRSTRAASTAPAAARTTTAWWCTPRTTWWRGCARGASRRGRGTHGVGALAGTAFGFAAIVFAGTEEFEAYFLSLACGGAWVLRACVAACVAARVVWRGARGKGIQCGCIV